MAAWYMYGTKLSATVMPTNEGGVLARSVIGLRDTWFTKGVPVDITARGFRLSENYSKRHVYHELITIIYNK